MALTFKPLYCPDLTGTGNEPCPACGATEEGNDAVNGVCQAVRNGPTPPGVIFGELPDTMELWSRPGDKVRFTGRNGYQMEQDRARGLLEVGKVYTVHRVSVGSFDSRVMLREHLLEPFNTVLFENVW